MNITQSARNIGQTFFSLNFMYLIKHNFSMTVISAQPELNNFLGFLQKRKKAESTPLVL